MENDDNTEGHLKTSFSLKSNQPDLNIANSTDANKVPKRSIIIDVSSFKDIADKVEFIDYDFRAE